MTREKLAARMARVQLSRQIKKEKKERREVILQVVFFAPNLQKQIIW